MMVFRPVAEFTPDEGQLLLVRLRDNTYRFGMVLKGKFANYEYHAEEFVTFAHPDRITHCMVVIPPVDFSTAEAEAETPKAEPPEAAAPSIVEAAMAAGAGIDHSEDIYT